MHAVVAIKQVPDTSNVRINPDTGTLIREGVPAIINPYDVHAVEMAVRLKERFGGKVTVLTMGPPKAVEALVECVEQGADRAILITDRKFAAADTLATSYVVAHAIEAIQAEEPVDILLFGKQAIDGDTAQVGPGVATRLRVPLITYAVEIESFDPEARTAVVHRRIEQGIEVVQTSLPALLTVEKEIAAISRAPLPNLVRAARYEPELWDATTLCREHRPQMATVRPRVLPMPEPLPEATGEVVHTELGLTEEEVPVKRLRLIPGEQRLNLEYADVIVAGGRGLGGPDGLALLEELAEVLGGVVGVSRPLVDAGWISAEHQVGQTGKTVRPKLYIAAGISGAVQHRVGMSGADFILAINTDPGAPIFQIADLGIVGDLYAVIPELIQQVKNGGAGDGHGQ